MRPPRRGRVGGSQEGMVSLPCAHRCPRVEWCQVKMLVWYVLPLAPAGKAGTSPALSAVRSEDRLLSLTDPSPSSTKGRRPPGRPPTHGAAMAHRFSLVGGTPGIVTLRVGPPTPNLLPFPARRAGARAVCGRPDVVPRVHMRRRA